MVKNNNTIQKLHSVFVCFKVNKIKCVLQTLYKYFGLYNFYHYLFSTIPILNKIVVKANNHAFNCNKNISTYIHKFRYEINGNICFGFIITIRMYSLVSFSIRS